MKLLHTGDWHVTEGPRLERTLTCLDAMIEHAEKERVELCLVGGDMHGTTVPHVATVRERLEVAVRLRRLAYVAPVVLIYGNHDAPNDLDIYQMLDAQQLIYVVDAPRIIELEHCCVFCLPYPSKRHYGAQLGEGAPSILGQKQTVEGALRSILAEWKLETATDDPRPCIMLGHLNIGGSHVGGGERILIGQEIELAPADLDELGMDYIALSHIHEHQQMARVAYYAGTPAPQDFGHRAPCGYVIADVARGAMPGVGFCLTPAPRMLTIQVGRVAPGQYEWLRETDPTAAELHGAEVKLHVELHEEDAGAGLEEELDRIERALADFGALRVVREIETIPRTRSRAPEIAAAETLGEKLDVWLKSLDERSRPDLETYARARTFLAELEGAPSEEIG